jgi:hypothetical protein
MRLGASDGVSDLADAVESAHWSRRRLCERYFKKIIEGNVMAVFVA